MSSVSLDPAVESRPDLAEVTRDVAVWLEDRPYRKFLDSRAVLREFGRKYTAREIIEFLAALKSLKLACVYFRVIDDNGHFADGKYDSFEDIPVEAENSSGDMFEVRREHVVQIYEFVS